MKPDKEQYPFNEKHQVGYENKNRQVVIRRTDIPGNDHLQWVHELECRDCGNRYGANGSDIWLIKCPRYQGGRPGLPTE